MNNNTINLFEYTIITCRKHGHFTETPFRHILGYGCPICDGENPEALEAKLVNSYEKLTK